jgi:heme O synthase-like polyprenyltransferase
LLHPAASLGAVYLVAAIVLGVLFVGSTFLLARDRTKALMVFRFSNIYLALLFAAAMLDVLV